LRLDGIAKPALHISAPATQRRGCNASRSFVFHRAKCLDRADRITVDGIPCTSAARTLIDLAGVLSDEQLEIAFESARRLGLTSVHAVAARHAALSARGRAGNGAMRSLLENQVVGERPLESPLEVRLARLLRQSSFPIPQRQATLTVANGDRYRVDFLFARAHLVVECDGFEAHSGHLRWKRDRRRVADIELEGYRVIQFTWDDVVHRPDDTLRRLSLAFSGT
jgi:very-short-patch-repair endonuclease